MISTEVKRTLVKSAPELWSELSDPEALARHLVDFGEIRITRVDPEQAVEWEGEEANGTVELKSSGWGTKVTLTVNRQLPQAVLAEVEDGAPEIAEVAEQDPPAPAQEQDDEQPAAETGEEHPQAPQQPIAQTTHHDEPTAQTPTDPRDTTPPQTDNPNTETDPEQEQQSNPQPEAADLGAQLAELETQMTEESTAVLSAVLDRLGAAHHRPFSRG